MATKNDAEEKIESVKKAAVEGAKKASEARKMRAEERPAPEVSDKEETADEETSSDGKDETDD